MGFDPDAADESRVTSSRATWCRWFALGAIGLFVCGWGLVAVAILHDFADRVAKENFFDFSILPLLGSVVLGLMSTVVGFRRPLPVHGGLRHLPWFYVGVAAVFVSTVSWFLWAALSLVITGIPG